MKKSILICVFYLISLSCFSQTYNSGDIFAEFVTAEITFKNQEKIEGTGKFGKKKFKFKDQSGSKTKKIKYQEIDYIRIGEKDKMEIYKCLPVKNQVGYFPFLEVYKGKDVQLYSTLKTATTYIPNAGSNVGSNVGGLGGFGYYNDTYTLYYLKRSFEDILTPLNNQIGFGGFKKRVLLYVSNCAALVEKINNKEYKVRKNVKEIFEYYDKNCN